MWDERSSHPWTMPPSVVIQTLPRRGLFLCVVVPTHCLRRLKGHRPLRGLMGATGALRPPTVPRQACLRSDEPR